MRRFVLVAGMIVAGIAAAQPLVLPAPAPAPAPPAAVVTDIAVAYTAEEGETRIEVGAWEADGPTVGGLIGTRVDYFTVEPATITLTADGSFPLGSLQIIAYGLNGGVVGGAPLKLSLEAYEDLIDLGPALQDQRLLATQPGIGRLWIESLLPRGTGTGERYRLPVVIIVR